PRQGPVFLEVPSDVPLQEAADAPNDPGEAVVPAALDPRALDSALARLRTSARPVLLAGLDALDAANAEPLRRFAEAWGIPVILSPKTKGLLRDDHPLCVGTIEGLGSAKLYEWIAGRDLVVMVGFDPVEFDRDWTAPAPVIHVSPLPNEDRHYAAAIELVGPVAAALEALAAPARPLDAADAARFRDEFRA